MGLIIHFDGGARGNPGPAGAGVVIRSDDGALLHESAHFLGRQTNNAAEYLALIHALRRAQRCPEAALQLFSDSELVVRQITGEYRVKSPKLAELYEQVQVLLVKVGCWSIQAIAREENLRADELANLAMDRKADVLVYDCDDADPDRPRQTPVAAPGDATPDEIESTRAVRVVVAQAPDPQDCPAGACPFESFTIESTLPAGLCVHAAHALLPTALAIQNTESQEFAAVPTMTVRCMRGGCSAVFQISPVRSNNGAAPRREGPPATE